LQQSFENSQEFTEENSRNLSGRDNIAISAHMFGQLTDFEQKYGKKRTETLYYCNGGKITVYLVQHNTWLIIARPSLLNFSERTLLNRAIRH
jgi:hypothetical protein